MARFKQNHWRLWTAKECDLGSNISLLFLSTYWRPNKMCLFRHTLLQWKKYKNKNCFLKKDSFESCNVYFQIMWNLYCNWILKKFPFTKHSFGMGTLSNNYKKFTSLSHPFLFLCLIKRGSKQFILKYNFC